MIFPEVLILTLFIFCTFAKGSNENMEERIEALERKLAAYETKDIETNKQSKVIERKLAAYETKDIETNKQFKVIERKLASLTKACEMEDIDLLNAENIGTNRGLISNLKTLVSFTTYLGI